MQCIGALNGHVMEPPGAPGPAFQKYRIHWMFETRCLCLCLPLFGNISIWILDAEFRNIEQILVY